MTPSARLQAVLDLLGEIEATPRPADALVSGYFRARRYIGSKDRAAVSFMLYDVLRHHGRLNWWLKKNAAPETPRNRLLTYLVLAEKKSPKIIGDLFSGGKFSPVVLTVEEGVLLRQLQGHTVDHPAMPEGIASECPEWAEASLKRRFGKSFAREVGALLEPAPLDIRINPLKTTRDAILAELRKIQINAEPCPFAPFGIRIKDRPALNALPMLKDGRIEIQDEGSQLVALIVDAKPGQRVADFCAGAGGKTLAISAQMQNKGRIFACDVLEGRLKRSAERFRRAGLHNIETRTLKDERDSWIKKQKGTFDRVLVDAPCSGVGAWRRNPDARWRSLGPGLESLLALQASILENAARLVKPGGHLIYATCSMLPEENEKQVESFMAAREDFSLIEFDVVWQRIHEEISLSRSAAPSPGPYLSLTPAHHKTDGFFGAVLIKQG